MSIEVSRLEMNINLHSYIFNELLEGSCTVIGLTHKIEYSTLNIGDILGVSTGLEGTVVEFRIVDIGIFCTTKFEQVGSFSIYEWLDIIRQSGNIQSYGEVKMIGIRVERVF